MTGAAGSATFQDRFSRRMAFIMGGVVSAIGTFADTYLVREGPD